MAEHEAYVAPSNSGRDTPFKAVCSCGWGTGGCSSATTADALKAEHLWLASTGQYDHVASGEHSREAASGKPCTLLGPREA